MNADGTGVTRLTNSGALEQAPAWSPDGRRIAFASRDTPLAEPEIYLMSADGSGITRLTNNPAIDRSPEWSPDGQGIVFESDRDGSLEIYVLDVPGDGT